ncbi:MAG: hypothetical protein H6650_07675 [Ardenticatenales bacterium]|nr:hypothetical protein [Ardenticatenales bacterium]
MSSSLADLLALINDVLQAAIVIFGSAVVLYNLPHWRRDQVTRAFSNLIVFVVVVYLTELLASRTIGTVSAEAWLRMGWVGICLVPAAQYHLSHTLLGTTGHGLRRRLAYVVLSYLIGLVFLVLALATDLLATSLVTVPRAPHLRSGPLFGLFALYFVGVAAAGIYNVWYARARCVTSTTRQRMTVILLAFLAAPLGVFPYQLINNASQIRLPIWLLLILGNLVVGLMFALLTYYLAYFGRVSPDRVVRVRLFKFMARVPMTGTIVLLVYVLVNRTSPMLGLPPETMSAIAVVAAVMLVEWAVHNYKRPLERVLQLNNEPDVRRIQELSERILTTRDLHQFLESILTAICDALRTPTAFVAALTVEGPRLEVVVGPLRAPDDLWEAASWQNLTSDSPELERRDQFILWHNYWIHPLYDRSQEFMLGILGMEGRAPEPDLSPEELVIFDRLVNQAAAALEDRILQQEVFAAVEGLLPEITALQRRRSAATYGSAPQLTERLISNGPTDNGEGTLLDDPGFGDMVRDALSHYWGGPKLTESPLLGLHVVQEALDEFEGNPAKALRAILQRAIEQQRPEGERRMTATEWILYNILELKFVQGQKVRDVARRLAMSESDLYRKQRVAIENVAEAVSRMERDATTRDGV